MLPRQSEMTTTLIEHQLGLGLDRLALALTGEPEEWRQEHLRKMRDRLATVMAKFYPALQADQVAEKWLQRAQKRIAQLEAGGRGTG